MRLRSTDFRPAGNVSKVILTDRGPAFVNPKMKGAQKAGKLFEKLFHLNMISRYDHLYHHDVWFHFYADGGWHWCQADGILCQPDLNRVTIFECKLKHTARSWFQLRELYLPVVKKAFGEGFEYFIVEVCKFYDPATPYPEKAPLLSSPLASTTPETVGVHVWRQ